MVFRHGKSNGDLFNIDTKGQNEFHGAVIVIYQQNVPGEPLSDPLVIPEKLIKTELLELVTKYLETNVNKSKPVRFESFPMGEGKIPSTKDFTHSWALATHLSYTGIDTKRETINNQPQNSADNDGEQASVDQCIETHTEYSNAQNTNQRRVRQC